MAPAKKRPAADASGTRPYQSSANASPLRLVFFRGGRMSSAPPPERGHSCPQQRVKFPHRQHIRAVLVFGSRCGQECPRSGLGGSAKTPLSGQERRALRTRRCLQQVYLPATPRVVIAASRRGMPPPPGARRPTRTSESRAARVACSQTRVEVLVRKAQPVGARCFRPTRLLIRPAFRARPGLRRHLCPAIGTSLRGHLAQPTPAYSSSVFNSMPMRM